MGREEPKSELITSHHQVGWKNTDKTWLISGPKIEASSKATMISIKISSPTRNNFPLKASNSLGCVGSFEVPSRVRSVPLGHRDRRHAPISVPRGEIAHRSDTGRANDLRIDTAAVL